MSITEYPSYALAVRKKKTVTNLLVATIAISIGWSIALSVVNAYLKDGNFLFAITEGISISFSLLIWIYSNQYLGTWKSTQQSRSAPTPTSRVFSTLAYTIPFVPLTSWVMWRLLQDFPNFYAIVGTVAVIIAVHSLIGVCYVEEATESDRAVSQVSPLLPMYVYEVLLGTGLLIIVLNILLAIVSTSVWYMALATFGICLVPVTWYYHYEVTINDRPITVQATDT